VEVRKPGNPPQILTAYNHVVLMNGAPDQIISCIADGTPTPKMNWVSQVDWFIGKTLSWIKKGKNFYC